MTTRLQRLHSMKAHSRWTTPDNYVAMLEQNMSGLVAAFKAAKQKHSRQSQGYGNDGLREVAFVPVLVKSQLDSSLVAIDMP